MSLNFTTELRNARLRLIVDRLDAATAPGKIRVFTGSRPVPTGSALGTQVLLGTLTLSKPCGYILDGTLTFEPIADDPVVDATGTIGFARAYDGDDNFVSDMSVGKIGSRSVLVFNNLDVQQGGMLSILSGVLTEGNQ